MYLKNLILIDYQAWSVYKMNIVIITYVSYMTQYGLHF